MHLKNITKIEKYKENWSTKYQRINTTDEDQNKQVYSQIKIHLKNITKIEKYRKIEVRSIKE